ncbi:MAG: ABC transporter permease subunit [Oscillospiraceae bacterium]|jgi:putative aldouronate transport system permease protein|nr:ABC transporter permease subunit [Oscillospiraceae bacterium]
MAAFPAKAPTLQKTGALKYVKRYWTLYLLLLLPIAYFALFRYFPMQYIQLAFKKYMIMIDGVKVNVWQMPWVDPWFDHFKTAFANKDFWNALKNTLILNGLDLVVGFPAPILLALLLNELTFKKFKRVTQTIAYMPHFLSWVIIYGLALQLFAPSTGLVNDLIRALGGGGIDFLNNKTWWVFTYVILGVWQSIGWNTIIYLAAITGISPELYEAAAVDGAGRFRKMWHVTLPGIRPTIVVLLIMQIGRIVGGDFDRPFAMTNKLVTDVSTVIPIFTYNYGILANKYGLATAVGLFQSVVCVIFLLASNKLAEKFGERGIW